METNVVTGEVVRSAMKVHSALGPGLLESAYRICMCHELAVRGLKAIQEKPVDVRYGGIVVGVGFRIDILVEDQVIVEIKSAEKHRAVYESQLLTYLRLSELKTGLLLNSNVRHMRHGIKRMVL